MPRYLFTGFFEHVLHGLQHGVNATLHRDLGVDDDGQPVHHGQPDESTVVARPGDVVETSEPYPHPLLVNEATGEPDQPPTVADALEEVAAAGERGAEALAVVKQAARSARKPRAPKNAPDKPAGGQDGGTAPTTSSESE